LTYLMESMTSLLKNSGSALMSLLLTEVLASFSRTPRPVCQHSLPICLQCIWTPPSQRS
jgi:hypothetical protein